MDSKTFRDLERGDLVKPLWDDRRFIVTENCGDHVTATSTINMTSPPEWELVRKAHKPKGKFGIVITKRAEKERHWTHCTRDTLEKAEETRHRLEKEYPGHIIEINDWSDADISGRIPH